MPWQIDQSGPEISSWTHRPVLFFLTLVISQSLVTTHDPILSPQDRLFQQQLYFLAHANNNPTDYVQLQQKPFCTQLQLYLLSPKG
jgi:hypothetical protein